jgi:hypothetical protein
MKQSFARTLHSLAINIFAHDRTPGFFKRASLIGQKRPEKNRIERTLRARYGNARSLRARHNFAIALVRLFSLFLLQEHSLQAASADTKRTNVNVHANHK